MLEILRSFEVQNAIASAVRRDEKRRDAAARRREATQP
jgi:hypothetical protein